MSSMFVGGCSGTGFVSPPATARGCLRGLSPSGYLSLKDISPARCFGCIIGAGVRALDSFRRRRLPGGCLRGLAPSGTCLLLGLIASINIGCATRNAAMSQSFTSLAQSSGAVVQEAIMYAPLTGMQRLALSDTALAQSAWVPMCGVLHDGMFGDYSPVLYCRQVRLGSAVCMTDSSSSSKDFQIMPGTATKSFPMLIFILCGLPIIAYFALKLAILVKNR